MRIPLASVIIATYNCGKFIQQSLESVLKQTYKPIEIIIVDDGSTDETPSILLPYREKFFYIRQDNQGLSIARNIGMRQAKGEFIGFLDADDVWHPRKLEMQVRCFQKIHDIGLVFTDFSIVDIENNILQYRCEEEAFPIFKDYGLSISRIYEGKQTVQIAAADEEDANHPLYYGDVFDHLCKGNFILPSTTLYKKECIEKIGLFWNEELRCATDQYFHLHFARHFPIAYLDTVTTDYRVGRNDALSGWKNTPQLIINTIRTLEDFYEQDENFRIRNNFIYRTILGKHYARLAYYYLSELDCASARKYAIYSLKFKPILIKPLVTLLLSLFPRWVLDILKKIK